MPNIPFKIKRKSSTGFDQLMPQTTGDQIIQDPLHRLVSDIDIEKWNIAANIPSGGNHTHTEYAANNHTHSEYAAASHVHNAANITSGTLPIARGGTGATTAPAALNALGSESTVIKLGTGTYATSTYGVAVGYYANAGGSYGVAVGYYANIVSQANAIAIGRNATSSGISAIAIGTLSQAQNSYSVSIGLNTLTSANNTVAIGTNITNSGANTIALGSSITTTGIMSVAIGSNMSALGCYAVAIGTRSHANGQAGVAIGYAAKANSTYGVALGREALSYSLYGTALGPNTYVIEAANYSTAIGYYATVSAVNTIQLGNATTLAALSCRVALTVTSDERDKADIEEIKHGLEFLNQITPINYVFNHRLDYIDNENLSEEEQKKKDTYGLCEYDREEHAKGTKKGNRRRVGVSAQQVQKVLLDIYGTDNYANIVNDPFYDYENVPNDVESQLAVTYESFIPFLISAVKELSRQNEELSKRINDVEVKLNAKQDN